MFLFKIIEKNGILNIFEPPKSNLEFFANITRTVPDSETQI